MSIKKVKENEPKVASPVAAMGSGTTSFGCSTFGDGVGFLSASSTGTRTFGSGSTMSFGKSPGTLAATTSSFSFGAGALAASAPASTGDDKDKSKNDTEADIEADEVDVNKLKLPEFEGLDKEIEVVKGDEDEVELIKL